MTDTDPRVEQIMAAISAASDENCTCHDTPLDNCLDIQQAIEDAIRDAEIAVLTWVYPNAGAPMHEQYRENYRPIAEAGSTEGG